MDNHGRRATLIGILANAFLFVIKFTAGMLSGSLALISDALNSFSDTIYSIAIFIAVRLSNKNADEDHPFGHHRAEPVAGLIIAILAGIIGFEIVKEGIFGLMNPQQMEFTSLGVVVLLVSMGLKTGMWIYFKKIAKRINSPALQAAAIDSRNDILISFTALFGVVGPLFGIFSFDYYAGILIGLFIIWSGYDIGKENIDYLMGKAPSKEIVDEICKRACSVKGVMGFNDVRAHYVGNYLHVEVHIEVPKDMHTKTSHDIGKAVQKLVEDMPSVDKAFVHIDPK